MTVLDEMETKKEQNEAVTKKVQDRVKQLESDLVTKDGELAELDRRLREQDKATAELQRSYALS